MPYLRESLRLDLLDECIWLLPWLRNAICFEIGFVLNLSFRSKGCSMTNHCSRITAWIFCKCTVFKLWVRKIQRLFQGTLQICQSFLVVHEFFLFGEIYLSNYSRGRFVLTPWSWIHLCGRSVSDLDGSSNGYGLRWSTSRKEKRTLERSNAIQFKLKLS